MKAILVVLSIMRWTPLLVVNRFDFIVANVSMVGLVLQVVSSDFHVIALVRPLRVLRCAIHCISLTISATFCNNFKVVACSIGWRRHEASLKVRLISVIFGTDQNLMWKPVILTSCTLFRHFKHVVHQKCCLSFIRSPCIVGLSFLHASTGH